MGRYVLTTFTLLLFALAGTSACKPKKKCSSCNPSVDGVPRGSQDDSSPFSDIGGGASPIGHSGPGKGKGPSGGSGTPPSGSSGTPPSGSSGTPETPIDKKPEPQAARTAVPDPTRVPPTAIPTATNTPTHTPAPFKACEPAALVPTATPTPVTPAPVPAPPTPTPTFVGDALLVPIRNSEIKDPPTLHAKLGLATSGPVDKAEKLGQVFSTAPRPPHQFLFCAIESEHPGQFDVLADAGMSACDGTGGLLRNSQGQSANEYLCHDYTPTRFSMLKSLVQKEKRPECRAALLGTPLAIPANVSGRNCLLALFSRYVYLREADVTAERVKTYKELIDAIPAGYSAANLRLFAGDASSPLSMLKLVSTWLAIPANKAAAATPNSAAAEMKALLIAMATRAYEKKSTFASDPTVVDADVRKWVSDAIPTP